MLLMLGLEDHQDIKGTFNPSSASAPQPVPGVRDCLAGWIHYHIHKPEPHILLFRRQLTPESAALAHQQAQVWSQASSLPSHLLTRIRDGTCTCSRGLF